MIQYLIFVIVATIVILFLFSAMTYRDVIPDRSVIPYTQCGANTRLRPHLKSVEYVYTDADGKTHTKDVSPTIFGRTAFVADTITDPFPFMLDSSHVGFDASIPHNGNFVVDYGCAVNVGGNTIYDGKVVTTASSGTVAGIGADDTDPDNVALMHSKSGFKSGIYMGSDAERRFEKKRFTEQTTGTYRPTDFSGKDIRFDQPNFNDEIRYGAGLIPDETTEYASKFHSGGYTYGATISPKMDITDWRA